MIEVFEGAAEGIDGKARDMLRRQGLSTMVAMKPAGKLASVIEVCSMQSSYSKTKNNQDDDSLIASDPVREILASTPPLQPLLDLTHHIHLLNLVQIAQVKQGPFTQ